MNLKHNPDTLSAMLQEGIQTDNPISSQTSDLCVNQQQIIANQLFPTDTLVLHQIYSDKTNYQIARPAELTF